MRKILRPGRLKLGEVVLLCNFLQDDEKENAVIAGVVVAPGETARDVKQYERWIKVSHSSNTNYWPVEEIFLISGSDEEYHPTEDFCWNEMYVLTEEQEKKQSIIEKFMLLHQV
jgi:hypothetical protein